MLNKDETIKIESLQPAISTWATKASGYSPPPAYSSLLDKIHSNKVNHAFGDGLRQIINGREYKIVTDVTGAKQLIPIRVPSAALFTYFTYNHHLHQ